MLFVKNQTPLIKITVLTLKGRCDNVNYLRGYLYICVVNSK